MRGAIMRLTAAGVCAIMRTMSDAERTAAAVREAEERAKRLGLTAADLHRAAGVHRATWNRWRAGSFAPSLAEWMRVQDVLSQRERAA